MAGKLSPKAAAAKKKRDLAFAKTPRRTAMKAENQRKRRAAKKKGVNLNGKDYDHNRGKFVSVMTNRSKTKTTNNTMPGKKKATGIKAAIKKAKTPKKAVKMTAKHKAAGKKFMAKGQRPGTKRAKKK